MNLTQEQINSVLEMNFRQAYNYYTALLNTYQELQQYENAIKHGITQTFPIHYYLNGYYIEKPKNKTVSIQGHGTININDFHEEIQQRQALIIHAILELQSDDLFTKR